MDVIEETEEKDTFQKKTNGNSSVKKSKKTKKTTKAKKKPIDEKPLLQSSNDVRTSLNNIDWKQKKEIGSNEQRDSGWCSKKYIKKPDEV